MMVPGPRKTGDDEAMEDSPLDIAVGGISTISEHAEDMGSLLLRLVGGTVVVLQMINEASSEEFNAVASRLDTLKKLVAQIPDKPVNGSGEESERRVIGFAPPAPTKKKPSRKKPKK